MLTKIESHRILRVSLSTSSHSKHQLGVHPDKATSGAYHATSELLRMSEARNILVVGEGRSGTSLLHDIVTSTAGEEVFAGFEPYAGFFQEAEGTRLHVTETPIGGLRALFNCSFALRPGAISKKVRRRLLVIFSDHKFRVWDCTRGRVMRIVHQFIHVSRHA